MRPWPPPPQLPSGSGPPARPLPEPQTLVRQIEAEIPQTGLRPSQPFEGGTAVPAASVQNDAAVHVRSEPAVPQAFALKHTIPREPRIAGAMARSIVGVPV